jgi:hypothetical protein
MTITPFLTLRLRGKKDTIMARQRARRVASLLHFGPHEQACIAAGTFVIACQALVYFRKARICFQIENNYLQVFATEAEPQLIGANPAADRMTGLFVDSDTKGLYRLNKPLPSRDGVAEEPDLGWLMSAVEATIPGTLFDELVRQNQEILALLHELRLYHGTGKEKDEKAANPHAA